MPYRMILGLTIVVLALSLSAATTLDTSAGPDPYADLSVDSVALGGGASCIASVDWSGLTGGKPLFIQVRLEFENVVSTGVIWQTSFVANADEVHKVKQNAGHMEVNFGPADQDPTTSHRVSVTFQTRQGEVIGQTYRVTGVCG